MSEAKWYLRTQDETFGPETEERLVEWARMGRIQPGQEISDDEVIWRRVEEVPFLDMRFSIDPGDGNPRGPFNRAAAESLVASGRLPPSAQIIETRPPFAVEPEADAPASGEMVSAPVEASVEKVVEKIVEVPVEKIVEKIVEKTVVDETRVRELEQLLGASQSLAESLREELAAAKADMARLRDEFNGLGAAKAAVEGELENERSVVAELKGRLDAAQRGVSAAEAAVADVQSRMEAAMKDAVDRELKLNEQIKALEDELRRLPQAASEVADIQAAMYSIMTREAAEIKELIDAEKAEADEFRRRAQERADRMLERRRELLKLSGANIEDMTRKALFERPEDPRTAQLRKELEELRRLDERKAFEAERRIRELEAELTELKSVGSRVSEGQRDRAELNRENAELRAQLQLRERELLSEREKCATLRQREAAREQTLMARLSVLESPSIGPASSIATNQSREAKLVKLPRWMRLGRG